MAEERHPGGPRGVNWLAIRTYYFSSAAVSYKQCAEKFGVSTRSIETRASKEGWVEERKRIFGDAEVQLRERAVESAVESLSQHEALAVDLINAVRDGINELKDMKAGRSKAETIKTLADAGDKAVRLHRESLGIKSGEASSDTNPDESTGVRIVREIVPAPARSGADVA